MVLKRLITQSDNGEYLDPGSKPSPTTTAPERRVHFPHEGAADGSIEACGQRRCRYSTGALSCWRSISPLWHAGGH
ncbi:hypothetical protein ACTD5D_21050 [Nocardia takedensis]|uniref:hypothetical protein n=1 Tax=Nocardia takedensis TaxID=259390 RepID=UPI003F765EC2